MELDKIALRPETTRLVRGIEKRAGAAVRGLDGVLAALRLGGRKAPYDDRAYEFLGGSGDVLRRRHYDKGLRLLWKAEVHAPYLGFRDASAEERQLRRMALRAMSPEEREAVEIIGGDEHRAILDREYTPREKEAVVAVLSAIGHGEAYAWLVSAQLLAEVESTGARAALTMQVLEEAKHFLVMRELVTAFRVPIPPLPAPEYILLERVFAARGVEKLFGMNVVVEGIALGLFGVMSHLPGLGILRLFHLDESRHAGFPANYFHDFPLPEGARLGRRARLERLAMLVAAFLMIPPLEAHLAELGIDAADFGGSTIRKILTLAERDGFTLPVSVPALMRLVDRLLNAYCAVSRPAHVRRAFTAQDTTRAERELAVERDVLSGGGD